jgi:hypothetical protein
MKLTTFKPKAFWLVVEGVEKTTTKGGLFIPETQQSTKIFKILKAGPECGSDVEVGGYCMIDAPHAYPNLEFMDNDKEVKMIMVHNTMGFWPASEDVGEWFVGVKTKESKKKIKLDLTK